MDNLKSTNLPCHIAEIKEGPYREKYLTPTRRSEVQWMVHRLVKFILPPRINSFSMDIDRVIRELTLSVQQKEPQSGDQICTQHLSNPRPVKLST